MSISEIEQKFIPWGKHYEMSVDKVVALFPTRIKNHYLTPQVYSGNYHAPDHLEVVLGLVELFGRRAIERGIKIDLDALKIVAIFHDTQRLDDGPDPDHGIRAAIYINQLAENGIIIAERQTIETAIDVCAQHNRRTEDIALNGDVNLRVFKLADYIERVRYERRDTPQYRNFWVEVDNLKKIAGNIYSDSELTTGLRQTRYTDAIIRRLRLQGCDPRIAALEAGKITNLFR